ncbi:hypothetical protein WN944_023616 [Citrus x changshan-huyou]|uniref:Uncharacterized protein n=1 Tax=Citrus x changshan-huyou TaxID=2935761 RepID=A0AAP0N5Y5_9ROSI
MGASVGKRSRFNLLDQKQIVKALERCSWKGTRSITESTWQGSGGEDGKKEPHNWSLLRAPQVLIGCFQGLFDQEARVRNCRKE